MTSSSMADKLEARYILESEVYEIQLAVEALNRLGFEHHVSTRILLKERDVCLAKAEKLTEQIQRLSERRR